MDKNAIKKYAVWARRELISRVSQKALQYGISDAEIVPANATSVSGTLLSADEISQRGALIAQINNKGYEQVMEEVAYTWFNRFIALRFMEVNGYLPSHVRVFTDEENNFKPQILTEAINLELDGLEMENIYALKDANDEDALFKYLLIVQCNSLSPILPRMFQRISDYTELLFPDNLLREGSVIEQMIAMIPEEDWKDAVQIIGWLYEAYNTERNEIVYDGSMSKSRIPKELLPAATTMFTPDWPVRYMVENSLGRLWVEGHPNDSLKEHWKYFLDEAEQEPSVQSQLAAIRKEYASITPEQLKCIDPCAGSGHILAYMFDVLVQIYEAYGYTARDAVRSIVENNLYGLDIDDRAAQLAYFTVMMKARQYDRRFLSRKGEDDTPDVPQPHVYAIVESNGIDAYALDHFVNSDSKLKAAMDCIMKEMRDAKEYGSILKITPVDFDALYARFDELHNEFTLSQKTILATILPLVRVAQLLAQKYDVVITNPPYLGSSRFSAPLDKYVKDNYTDVKSDLSMVMYKRAFCGFCKRNGFVSFITTTSWMFLSSFEKLRQLVADTQSLTSLVDYGTELFDGKVGHNPIVSWVSRNSSLDYRMNAVRLVDYCYSRRDDKEPEFFNAANHFVTQQSNFSKIPGTPFTYSVSDRFFTAYDKGTLIGKISTVSEGIKTGDNDRFLRLWHEIDSTKFSFAQAEKLKWIPHHKGGEYRKWYGNRDWVINWENDGQEIKNAGNSGLQGKTMYFGPFASWSKISLKGNPLRYFACNCLFDSGAPAVSNCKLLYTMGFLNGKIGQYYLSVLSPTLNLQVGDVKGLPLVIQREDAIENIVKKNIALSQDDWDAFETSWDFRKHPLVPTPCEWTEQRGSQFADTRVAKFSQLAWHYDQWENACTCRFNSLKENEEELNRIFIDIYGLQHELTPDVADGDVTVLLADRKRDIKSLISYAVGCMLGRYSLDFGGLIYAGGEWDNSKYVTFKADKDSIIPICDDEYFADDIVGRFIRFIEIVYGKDTLQENLRFIADALGGSGQPKDVIRNYFLNDFYTDHLKIYQKRPIYWLFDSGKKGGFRALVYMHRYQPDTIARMRTDYVHEQQARYRTAIADLEHRIASAGKSEQIALKRKLTRIQDQAAEIQGYEEKIHHLADQYISIDLDDGVKVNYAKFQDVLAKIK